MIILVTGGSASGKSAYAEMLAREGGAVTRYYVAAMKPYGEEGKARVEKHRRMRREGRFVTIERYERLEELVLPGTEPAGRRAVLLECMSNLLANEQFGEGGSDEEIRKRVQAGILCLKKQTKDLIIVTNEVFSDGEDYDPETRRYIRLLGELNCWLAGQADQVTEVVFGIPVIIKGGKREAGGEDGEGI
ncbi:MAG: bifunctional adenosylcobinamide kinase/adenosylcobinamide-phosphate guanylyltransferase [Eubacteriales bacterium]|nr:bifunctional adenosylcobinamide kinase/adenosylcobinamide-phosphate guanylyltransferase [Eubacteriales bacterium]